MASPDADADGWDHLLAAMESDLAAILDPREVEGGERAIAAPWNAPSGIGPMPERLLPRAQQLLANLNDGIRRLETERTAVGDHLAVLRTLPATSGESRAVYLDVTG